MECHGGGSWAADRGCVLLRVRAEIMGSIIIRSD
jgi:hypothetical protein